MKANNILDCIECGSCNYVCPAFRPIVQFVKIGKLNFDNNEQIVNMYQVQDIPTMIVFKDGKDLDRINGTISRKALESRIKSILGQ